MTFLILSVISGLLMIAGVLYFALTYRKRWKMPKGLFIRSCLFLIASQLFYLSFLDSLLGYWTGFADMHIVLKALFVAALSGLFFELIKFLALDRFFKDVRNFREAVYFSFGWNGLTLVLGVIIIIGSVGLYFLMSTTDPFALFSDFSKEQMQQIDILREQAKISFEQPIIAFLPLVERAAILITDIFTALLIILGLNRRNTGWTWLAVLARIAVVFVITLCGQWMWLAYLSYAVVAGASYLGIRKIKGSFPDTWVK